MGFAKSHDLLKQALKTANHKHIFVDLDGTLVREELAWEHFKSNIPYSLSHIFKYLFKPLALKQEMSYIIQNWTFRTWLVELLLNHKKQNNCILVLITGSNLNLAEKVAQSIKPALFDHVIGSSLDYNCLGLNKLAKMKEITDNVPFYIGNSKQDLPIFKATQTGCLISANQKLIKRVKNLAAQTIVICEE